MIELEKVKASFLKPFQSGNRFMKVMGQMGYSVVCLGPQLVKITNRNGAVVYQHDPNETGDQAFDQFWSGIKQSTKLGLLSAYRRHPGIGTARFVPFPDTPASPASAA